MKNFKYCFIRHANSTHVLNKSPSETMHLNSVNKSLMDALWKNRGMPHVLVSGLPQHLVTPHLQRYYSQRNCHIVPAATHQQD